MDFTAGFFESDTVLNEGNRAAGRRATAAALARCKQRFAGFLSGPDLPARFDLIEPDLRQVCADVVAEYGGDEESVVNSVTSVLAAGGFCDDCKAWKSGPRAGCTCGGDKDEPGADCDVKAEDDAKKTAAYDPDPEEPESGRYRQTQDSQCPKCGRREGAFEDGKCSACGYQAHTARWSIIADALVTEKLPKTPFGKDPLKGPSPKIDKNTWKPNALNEKGNLHPIETEGKGSPNPTVHQDVAQVPDHTKDPHEQTEAVLKHETLPTGGENAGFDTERNITQYPTRTFPNRHQEKPVTREVFPHNSAAQDPDHNPIIQALEAEQDA